jgi:predicted Zn-dependent peptidase
MKKIFLALFAMLMVSSAVAQLDRSKRPEAGPAPKLEFKDYDIIELDNGLKIIVVEDHKLPRVSMSLIIDRDPIFEGEKAGYVSLAGEMLRQGTTSRPKATLDEEIDFMGASLNTSSSSAYASGLSKYTEKLFELLADVAQNPAFPAEEFEKIKEQQLSSIQSSKDDPAAVNARIFNQLLYGANHPYGESATEETVTRVDLEDCKQYYNNYWIPNITYLAVVGDVKKRQVKKLAKKYFGKWERANVPVSTFEAPAEQSGIQIAVVNNESAVQSVVQLGNTIMLKPGDEDVLALRLADQVLGGGSLGRLFKNIREDKAYTYGAYSSYSTDELIGSFTADASVRNEVTDSAVVEFLKEFERMRTEPVPADELEAAKNYIIGSFGRSLERPQTVASFALNKERYNLPKDYYENYLSKLGKLTAEDVMKASNTYMKTNMLICVTGKASQIGGPLEALGTVTYYNKEGKQIDKPGMPIPEGVTAQSVIDNYVKAIGGKENIAKVKDITYKMTAVLPGAPFKPEVTVVKKENRFYFNMEAEGFGVLQKIVYNGSKGKVSGMQGSAEMDEEQLKDMKAESRLFPQARYGELGYTLKLVEIANVNDQPAYVVEVTSDGGNTVTQYYNMETGFLVKEEQVQESPQGPVTTGSTYGDYKAVSGVKVPYKQGLITGGPADVSMTVTDVKVNSKVPNSTFE